MTAERTPAGNTGLASGGVTCIPKALCFVSNSLVAGRLVVRELLLRKPQSLGIN